MFVISKRPNEPRDGSYPTWTVGQFRTALSTVMPTVLQQNPKNNPLQDGVFFGFDRLHAIAGQHASTAPLEARYVPVQHYMLPHNSVVALNKLLNKTKDLDQWVWVGMDWNKRIEFFVQDQWALNSIIAGYGDELFYKVLRAVDAARKGGDI